jgi:hypothetical protein
MFSYFYIIFWIRWVVKLIIKSQWCHLFWYGWSIWEILDDNLTKWPNITLLYYQKNGAFKDHQFALLAAVVFAVFKALCGDGVCRCYFFLLTFQCAFQAPVDDKQSVEEYDQRALRRNFIFFMSSCVKLSFYCITNYFSWYESDMRHLSGVFLKKMHS